MCSLHTSFSTNTNTFILMNNERIILFDNELECECAHINYFQKKNPPQPNKNYSMYLYTTPYHSGTIW